MALLERVTTLVKANINDLVRQAENPEKLVRQLLLDMENQLMQVKTQAAIAIADQHLLRKKQEESAATQRDWIRKAELALGKGDEPLARVALERSLTFDTAAGALLEQIEYQSHQVEMLKSALRRLEQKMAETQAIADVLLTRQRRAKLAQRSGVSLAQPLEAASSIRRLNDGILQVEASGEGQIALLENSSERQLEELARTDRVDRLLAELKAKSHA